MRDGQKVGEFDLLENLEVNQRVEFEVRNGEYEGRYPTQVVDIINDSRFIINAPFSQGRVIRVSANTKAEIFVRGKTALYSLPVRIVDKDFDSTHLFIVELAGKVNKIQDRRYFRLEIYKPVDCKLINQERDLDKFENIRNEDFFKEIAEVEADENKDFFGVADDISAGGVKLLTEKRLKIGQLLDLNLEFVGDEFRSVLGEVIRVNKVVKNNDERYELGVEFLGLGRSERDELMRWLFEKQRELRKKGLI
ncbi:MAG: flagellar brake protein [Bacillota bacterium]